MFFFWGGGCQFSFHCKTTIQGQFRPQIIIFREETGRVSRQTPLRRVALLVKLKTFELQKGPLLPLFRRPVKITAISVVAMLRALGNSQCKTRELP